MSVDPEKARQMMESARQQVIQRLRAVADQRQALADEEREAVHQARTLSMSWDLIADNLGTVRSNVWKKYHSQEPSPSSVAEAARRAEYRSAPKGKRPAVG